MKKRFTARTRVFLAASGAVIAIALILQLVGLGINFSADLMGGTLLTFTAGADADEKAVADMLDEAGYSDFRVTKGDVLPVATPTPAVEETAAPEQTAAAEETVAPEETVAAEETAAPEETVAAEETVAPEETAESEATGVSLKVLIADAGEADEVRSLIEGKMTAEDPAFAFVSSEQVGKAIGRDFGWSVVKAALIALVLALAYVWVRFDLRAAVVALGCVLHDALITCAFMVLFRWIVQANAAFVAVILAVGGCSLASIILTFHRVREISRKPGFTQTAKIDLVESAAEATLHRTMIVSGALIVALVVLMIAGTAPVRMFSFPLIIGVLASAYSSLLLGGQIWAMWVDAGRAKKAKMSGAKKSKKA